MSGEEMAIFERIAVALERQVGQTDEQIARQSQWRNENTQRADKQDDERDAELRSVQEMNQTLLSKLDAMLAVNTALEKAFAATCSLPVSPPPQEPA